MPPVVRQANLMTYLNGQETKMRVMAQQQNVLISNSNGAMVLTLGLVPGSSPAQYALAAWPGVGAQPAGSVPLVQLGQLPSGDYGLAVFNAAGDLLTLLDDTGVTLYSSAGDPIVQLDDTGMQVLDAAGHTHVQAGALGGDAYGLRVTDPSTGATQTIAALAQYSNLLGTTLSSSAPSSSPDMAGPSVQATVGPSGNAKVEVSCYIGTTEANQTGSVWLAVNGTISQQFLAAGAASTAISSSCAATRVLQGLTPGVSTFELGYSSSNGAAVDFSGPTLIVTPL